VAAGEEGYGATGRRADRRRRKDKFSILMKSNKGFVRGEE
jgi:hypothetical protein